MAIEIIMETKKNINIKISKKDSYFNECFGLKISFKVMCHAAIVAKIDICKFLPGLSRVYV